ncbi:MAG: hypothetical protein RIC95_01995 [Vicingaceae bacterium]
MSRVNKLVFLLLFLEPLVTFSQSIQLFDSNRKSVEGVLALYNNSFLLGISDSNGILEFSKKQAGKTVLLHRLGYQDTTILLKSDIAVEMKQSTYQLQAVNVFENPIRPLDKLQRFVSFNAKRMETEKVDIPLRFTTETVVPDSNWNEVRKGNLKLNYNSYDKKSTKVWNSNYCDFNVEVDSAYWFYSKREELVLGTLIGMFEKDGMRIKRLLRSSNLRKDYNVEQVRADSGYAFEIMTNNIKKRKQFVKVVFNSDSSIYSYEYRWLNEINDTVNAGLKKAKHLQHYSFWKYTNEVSVSIDSVHSKVSFVSKSGLDHEVDFRAKRLKKFEQQECLNLSIFLEFNPKHFQKRGLLEKVSFR